VSIDREKVLQAAQKYVEKKKYDRAIAEYQRIIQEDPNDARTLLKIGDLQARLQAYPEAIATYDRVGQHYASQGFALKAIAVYKQIRELIKKHSPELADRYGHIVPKLAEIYTQLGLTSDALAAYDEVATRLQRSGRDREAIDVFRRMVELDPTNPLPHLRLAEACCRVQSLDEAIGLFWRAGELLLGLGRREDAIKVVERILHFRIEPRFARVAAELYLQSGTRESGLQALAKLQICFQADPRDLETLGLLARAFQTIGQEPKALEVQKEMARIAREQGKLDLFRDLLQHLRHVAGDDEQVRALESVRPANRSSAPAEPIVDLTEEAVPSRGHRPVMPSAPDVVVVEDHIEVVEEVANNGFDARAHAKKAVVDADSFRKLRLFPKAIETLHIALEIDPGSLDIRSKLRDVLIESGDRDGAIAETVNLAALYLDRGELDQAEPLLREVLEVEPNHPAALAMLEQIVPDISAAVDTTQSASARPMLDTFDPDAPLPSYDLEEVSADQALHHSRPHASPKLMIVDEPFAGADDKAPLPSFPLGEDAPEQLEALSEDDIDLLPLDEEVAAPRASVSPDVEAIEEVLDEAEFFAARGLFEDARTILQEQLTRTPHHRLVQERLREVEEAIAAAGASQTIDRSRIGASRPPAPLEVTETLGALDPLDPVGGSQPPPSAAADAIDVDQVFATFKAGVRAQVVEADSATHYDLGVAYKEMGLIAEAIGEFEQAGRDPHRECMCFAMIGLIYLEQNQLDRASECYKRALTAEMKTVEQEMNLYYDLGTVCEMKGEKKDSLYYFQKIARRDPGYRDVAERIDLLSGISGEPIKAPPPARAVGDDDEFDRAFDDLFEGK
jgi:tetratricopeptide (TPR) repeat protein